MYNRTAFILFSYENTDYLLQIVVQVFVHTPIPELYYRCSHKSAIKQRPRFFYLYFQ